MQRLGPDLIPLVFVACLAGLLQTATQGQTGASQKDASPVPTRVAADPYAGESMVLTRMDVVYSYAPDGTGWRQRTVAVRVQSEAALRQLGVLTVPFAGSSEKAEIVYARVRHGDGTVAETPVADAQEQPEEVTRAAPFYSDLKQKQLPIRGLRVGDTLEWQARVVRTKPEAAGEFWGVEVFPDDGVVLEESIELHVPAGKPVKVWSPTLKPRKVRRATNVSTAG